MKWTFLKRRSEVQKLEIQVSPVSGTCFDPSNPNNSKRQNEQTPVDVGSTSNEQDEVSKNNQSTLQAVPAPIQEQLGEQNPIDTGSTLQENEQKRIDMVLSEIQTILTDRPPPLQKGRTRQESAALPVSENDHPDASMTTETESAIPVAHQVERKLNEPRISYPVAHEIEALLGISTPKN